MAKPSGKAASAAGSKLAKAVSHQLKLAGKVPPGRLHTKPRTGGASMVRRGQYGEARVRQHYNIGPQKKTKIRVNGRNRIPDGLTRKALTEVKNVSQQALTEQLRDFLDFARRNGLEFHLYVKPNTKMSKQLLEVFFDPSSTLYYPLAQLRFIP